MKLKSVKNTQTWARPAKKRERERDRNVFVEINCDEYKMSVEYENVVILKLDFSGN